MSYKAVTEHTDRTSLDRSLASGIAWTASMRWGAQIISWAATFYAARALAPNDFGLVAMAMLAIGLARMVQEFGLDAILVQDRSIVGETLSKLAGFVLILGASLFAVYVLLAPLIAGFFKEPQVSTIIIALSLFFVFDAIQVVPYALLQRTLQFRRLAIVSFLQIFVTSVVLVGAAYFGLGLWALVASKLAGELAVTILLLLWQPYRAAWPRGVRQLAHPLLQGWRNLAARFAWYGYSNADQTIIGRVLGADALGAYSFATTFSSITQQEIGAVISRVIPGLFTEVQARPGELRRYFLILTEFVTVLSFPAAFGLALTADLLVPLALGDQWDAVVVPLRLLCVYSAFLSSQMLLSHVLIWTGQFRVNMWCSILAVAVMPLVMLWAVRYGVTGIGWAWVLAFPAVNIPAFVFAFRTIRVTLLDWLIACRPAAVAAAVMAIAVLGLRSALSSDISLLLAVAASIAIGVVSYLATLWWVFRPRVRVLIALAGSLRKGSVPDQIT